eukprot:gene17834-biopygen17364
MGTSTRRSLRNARDPRCALLNPAAGYLLAETHPSPDPKTKIVQKKNGQRHLSACANMPATHRQNTCQRRASPVPPAPGAARARPGPPPVRARFVWVLSCGPRPLRVCFRFPPSGPAGRTARSPRPARSAAPPPPHGLRAPAARPARPARRPACVREQQRRALPANL